jgi:protein-S-isoprenylcysteine O-methyltransferase Ste14
MKFWHVFVLISLIWVLSEVVLAFAKRSFSSSAEKRDQSSLRLLWLTIAIAVTLGVLLGIRGIGYIPGVIPWVPYSGLVLMLLGLVARWSAIITLNRYFTVDVAIATDHQLVERGLYRHIRHPAYAGSLFSFLGLGVAFSNYLSIIVIIVPITAVFMYRIKVEEAALHSAFGDQYAAYCRRTKRLLPGIY